MTNRNLFEDDWRDCLQAHYRFVLRANDAVNESSLATVLKETGFVDEQIQALRVEILGPQALEAVEAPADDIRIEISSLEPVTMEDSSTEPTASVELLTHDSPDFAESPVALPESAGEAEVESESIAIEDEPGPQQLSLF